MPSVYTGPAASALALIKAKGAPVTLTRTTTAYDPVTQAVTSTSTATATLYGVGLSPGRSAEYRIGSLQSRNILEMHLALQGAPFEPANGDVIAWKGHEWRVIWVDVLDPAGDFPIYAKAYAER